MPVIAGGLDVAELCLWTFFLFFFGLVLYIRREDRREGYPLEEDMGGRILTKGGPFVIDAPKKFILPFDRGVRYTPTDKGREPVRLPARRTARFDGAPLEPTGDPLVDGMGPASFAMRDDIPDITAEGNDRIVPMRLAHEYSIAREDPDPTGWPAVAADGKVAGRVTQIWVDQSDRLIRYLEIATNGGRNVLAPMAMLNVNKGRKWIEVSAITAAQFERAPTTASPDRVTRYEEDRTVGYFGGGHLYATASRSEPIL